MMQRLRVATWNVHCGVFRGPSGTPAPDLEGIADCLRAVSADLICLQEFFLPPGDERRHAEELAAGLGLRHVEVMALSPSHLLDGSMGLSVLSRFPLIASSAEFLPNPRLRRDDQDKQFHSHDKGILTVTLACGPTSVQVMCVQLFPFHTFRIDPRHSSLDPARDVFKRLLTKLVSGPALLCGDLNVEDLDLFVPDARAEFELTDLVHRPTRPNGHRHDHLLHSRHLDASAVRVISSPSDHHLCVADMTLRSDVAIAEGSRAPAERASRKPWHEDVCILHLSDLHFGPGECELGDIKTPIEYARRRTMRDLLVETIEGGKLPRCPDFVVVSGDVTIASNPQGWQRYLDSVDPLIQKELLPPVDRFVLVPGNHDVVWSDDQAGPADEAKRWQPFISALGQRHVRPWIPAVDGEMRDVLRSAKESMVADSDCWGGIVQQSDQRTLKQRTTAFPFVFDRRLGVLLYAFNSSSVSGTTMTVPPQVADALSFLQQVEGPNQKQLRMVLSAFAEVRRIDPARIEPLELTLFNEILAEMARREGARFAEVLKVVVLHHHVTSIFPEEVKSFETLLNAGLFKSHIQAHGVHLILHGHKHWAEAFIDTAVSGGGRHVVVSGGTIGGAPPPSGSAGFYWVDWQRASGRLSARFMPLHPLQHSTTETSSKASEKVFWIKRRTPTGRLELLVDDPDGTGQPDLREVLREAERQVVGLVKHHKSTRSTGWAHRMRSAGTISTIATAYGLKILALTGGEHPAVSDLRPRVIETLLSRRTAGGGWTATSQGSMWRPEATCWVADALHAWNADAAVVGEAVVALERLLDEGRDNALRTRTVSVSMVLRLLSRVRPRSPWVPRLASLLATSAACDASGAAMAWSEQLIFGDAPQSRLMDASSIHTAHAMIALIAAHDATEGAHGLSAVKLQVARAWLLQQPWDDREEQIQRESAAGRYEQLTINHFTAPWVIVALLRAGQSADNGRLRSEVHALLAKRSEGLWNWGRVELPIWATHDALVALREAAFAGVRPSAC